MRDRMRSIWPCTGQKDGSKGAPLENMSPAMPESSMARRIYSMREQVISSGSKAVTSDSKEQQAVASGSKS